LFLKQSVRVAIESQRLLSKRLTPKRLVARMKARFPLFRVGEQNHEGRCPRPGGCGWRQAIKKRANRKQSGFSMLEIMIVVGIMGILMAFALPVWMRARSHGRAVVCQENLSQINGAKEVWALENRKSAGDTVAMTDLVSPGGAGYLKREPKCPANGTYEINPIATNPTCSINVQGRELYPDPQHLHKLP